MMKRIFAMIISLLVLAAAVGGAVYALTKFFKRHKGKFGCGNYMECSFGEDVADLEDIPVDESTAAEAPESQVMDPPPNAI